MQAAYTRRIFALPPPSAMARMRIVSIRGSPGFLLVLSPRAAYASRRIQKAKLNSLLELLRLQMQHKAVAVDGTVTHNHSEAGSSNFRGSLQFCYIHSRPANIATGFCLRVAHFLYPRSAQ
jgi:hypothetical protein